MPKPHPILLCILIPLALARPSTYAFKPARTPLNFETLTFDLDDPATFRIWEKFFDQVHSGAMPPKDKPRPDPALKKTATTALHRDLLATSNSTRRTKPVSLVDLYPTLLELCDRPAAHRTSQYRVPFFSPLLVSAPTPTNSPRSRRAVAGLVFAMLT